MKTYTATHKYARIAPRKTRYVMDMIRGKTVNEALNILQSSNRRAAPLIKKVLNSAVANATSTGSDGQLMIERAVVDGGPTLKRFRPGPMGRAMRIRKRTSHITISLAEFSSDE